MFHTLAQRVASTKYVRHAMLNFVLQVISSAKSSEIETCSTLKRMKVTSKGNLATYRHLYNYFTQAESLPRPFPIPKFRQNTEKNLQKKILTDGANFGHDAHDVHTTTVDATVWGRS